METRAESTHGSHGFEPLSPSMRLIPLIGMGKYILHLCTLINGVTLANRIPDPDIVVGYNWKSICGNYKLAFDELPDSLKFAFPIVVDGHFAFPFFSVEMRIDAGQRLSPEPPFGRLNAWRSAILLPKGLRKKTTKPTSSTGSDPGDPNVTHEHFLIKKWHFEEMKELFVARHGSETLYKWMMKENRKWIASGLQELAKA
ncbi:hypothetical protein BO83DRAFT_417990 [Aspergillus eucalypticola CBS 122712]|uniref:Uncharacterized protein n=1 Tax=Aspergillus eucalypticola (strain CBS 122712 / IBT 29274) TaxID=1448314 RepID=A0A317VAQ4_ASPEC|nr:uncharacterized protein BO83DRAFT_417990 [Aspergillus eucalypticola CBS 122712]PWY71434.1 hypothetical protein BO83DRAFT_417990 [Aspergillus eucalypticola CBS 122712]